MKTFAIYGAVELVDPPSWLADFRARYDKPYPLHLTFKQPCWIDEAELPALKQTVKRTVKQLPLSADTFHVRFSSLLFHPPEAADDGYIMLRAEDRPELHRIQRSFVASVAQYRNYTKPELAGYEAHFEPHITIGRNLDTSIYKQALASIPSDFDIQGIIPAIVLAVMPEDTSFLASDPVNRTVFPISPSAIS